MVEAALSGSLSCGSPGLYREVAAELRAAGVDVPADPGHAVVVTSSERRMAELAAAGASHREIAEALFLTPHLVDRALAELRTRLGVGADAELLAALPAR
jgi:DNA-binding CsgD family transcriptional regulator